jgi:hypothetical protein
VHARRLARLLVPLALVAAVFAVPVSAATPFAFQRVSLGKVSGPVERTFAVPRGAVLAGVTWASGTASVSARAVAGAWEALENDVGEAGGRPGTEPYWLAPDASLVAFRIEGVASDVRVDFVGAGSPSSSSSSSSSSAPPKSWTLPRLGKVITRPGWGADERMRSGRVEYMTPKALIVHHTVTRNDYTRAEAPGLIRAVYAYHTRSRGWQDIGYNVLVDRFGTVYEGRYGGFFKGIVGAHTAGFNEQAMSVSLLGNYEAADTPPPVVAALIRAGAWASERWKYDPRGRVTLTSAGSDRFPRGARVTVYRMPGHRDLGRTACPGNYAYERLAAVRADAWKVLHPAQWRRLRAVFSKPVVEGAPVEWPHPVSVSATLSHTAWWKATILTSDGEELAVDDGHSTKASVSWNGVMPNGLPALPGTTFTYHLTADDHMHGVSDPVGGTFAAGWPSVA